MLINTEKIDLDVQSKTDGNTPLHLAAVKGHGLIVALLLIRGARVRIPNKSKSTSRYPISSSNCLFDYFSLFLEE
jgi:ankyrin repeat protein